MTCRRQGLVKILIVCLSTREDFGEERYTTSRAAAISLVIEVARLIDYVGGALIQLPGGPCNPEIPDWDTLRLAALARNATGALID
jgi:hypothetical protein